MSGSRPHWDAQEEQGLENEDPVLHEDQEGFEQKPK
jgi:hypothetical protein